MKLLLILIILIIIAFLLKNKWLLDDIKLTIILSMIAIMNLFKSDKSNNSGGDGIGGDGDGDDGDGGDDGIVGGDGFDIDISPNRVKKMYIDKDEKMYIDGHNMIHSIKSSLNPEEFNMILYKISGSINTALKDKDKHIIIKNSTTHNKNYKKFIKDLVKLSKKYPDITYHIAYDSSAKKDNLSHALKGRDDYLLLRLVGLVGNGYIISNDRFRDYTDFKHITPFTHIKLIAGKIVEENKINPTTDYKPIKYPGIGKQFLFSNKKQAGINNGDIYTSTDSKFATVYIS